MNYINRCIHIPFLIVLYSLLIVGKLAADGDLFQTNSGYTLKFEHLSLDQGLSQVTVNTIIQDHRGFIWFATRDGLNRFDGYHFRIYRHNPFDSTSISNNRVNVLCEDHQGYLWVGTDEGLNRYDRDGDTFLSFKHDVHSPNSISDNRITALVEDQMGNLWIGTAKGVDQLNKNRNLFRYPGFKETRETEGNVRSVSALYEDSRGRIWLGTQQNGLYILDPQGEVFSLFQHKNLPSTFFVNNKINTLSGESSGNLWIGTTNGLVHYHIDRDQLQIYPSSITVNTLASKHVKAIHRDREGLLWIGTNAGLTLFDEKGKRFKTYRSENHSSAELSDNDIQCITEDNSGVIWIGTAGGGINKYNPRLNRFAHFRHDSRKPNSLSNNFVYSLFEDHNQILWIGTNEGVDKFDRKSGRFQSFRHDPGNPNSLSHNQVRSLYRDNNDYLWTGTYDGLNRLNTSTGAVKVYRLDPDNDSSPGNNVVITIHEDRHNQLWIGTNGGGLNRFDRKNEIFTRFTFDTVPDHYISSNSIFCIHEMDDDVFLLGTYGSGLIRFNAHNGDTKFYRFDKNNRNSPSSNFIYSLHEDSDGIIWIGTFGAGLNRFDPQTETFTHYGTQDGLPNDLVYGILEDDRGYLWLSTNHGLSKFNPYAQDAQNPFRNYDKSEGLQSNEFNFGAYFKNSKGEMFFGGVNGFNIFHPDSISDHSFIPPIVITDFEIMHKSVENPDGRSIHKPIGEAQKIEISYKDNHIGFEFSALDFSNPMKNLYAYQLSSIDSDWVYTNAQRRFAHFTNLPGGEYYFRVKGTNSDGVWNDEGITLQIKIHPAFWNTTWFRTIIILLVALLIISVYKIRMHFIRKRHKQLEEINLALNNEIKVRGEAEDALRRSEEKYRTITENINAGIYRNIPNKKGKFIEVNPAFVEILGYDSKEDLLNTPVSELYFDQKQRRAFQQKILRKGFVKDEEIKLKRKDGDPIWCSVTAVAVFDEKGKIRYYDGLVEDITERKRVQQALQESEEKYRILVERANDGIIIIKEGMIAYVNNYLSQLCGYSVEELVGKPFLDFVHPDELRKVKERYEKRIRYEPVESTYETVLSHKQGHKIIAEVNAGMITYEGEPADLVFMRDITERKQLETQIRQSQKMQAIGHLAGGVAHDFNNILTVINGHAELAQFRMRKNNRAYKHVQEIVKSAQRASDLVRQLLAFSRQQIIEPKIIDVNQVIGNLDSMLHRMIGEDIQMILDLDSKLPLIKADPGQIEQVLMNLLINARDAINDNPKVKGEKKIIIKTGKVFLDENDVMKHLETRMGPHVLISITDNGKGMDERTIDKIFDPFFTTKEQGKGTGLGLATLFGIVKQNEGNIIVDSKPGQGSTFKVYWPYNEDTQAAIDENAAGKLDISGEECILIVEDDPKVRNFAREALQSYGYRVIEADHGIEALDCLKKHSNEIDLLLSDVVMPEMGGQELAQEVKENYPRLKVILVSGYTDSQIIHNGTREHSINFLYKPFSIQSLLSKVREVLDQSG